jgi:hypothetical protein
MAVIKRIKTIFQFRRGTTEEWKLNKDIIPAAGEPCFDLDLGTLKIGDGKTTYENLKVMCGATISDDGLALIVEGLQADVAELKVLIGEDSVEDQIAKAMEGVATAESLETVINNMTVLESQVTTSTDNVTEIKNIIEQNNTIVTELQTIVENKADVETVTELQTVIEQKADTETVKELQTIVENKVDNSVVDALEVEMKNYIEEQIKLVEVGNIDDGEI